VVEHQCRCTLRGLVLHFNTINIHIHTYIHTKIGEQTAHFDFPPSPPRTFLLRTRKQSNFVLLTSNGILLDFQNTRIMNQKQLVWRWCGPLFHMESHIENHLNPKSTPNKLLLVHYSLNFGYHYFIQDEITLFSRPLCMSNLVMTRTGPQKRRRKPRAKWVSFIGITRDPAPSRYHNRISLLCTIVLSSVRRTYQYRRTDKKSLRFYCVCVCVFSVVFMVQLMIIVMTQISALSNNLQPTQVREPNWHHPVQETPYRGNPCMHVCIVCMYVCIICMYVCM